MVHEHTRDADEPSIHERRFERQDVIQVLAARVGVVGDDEIPFAPLAERNVIAQDVVETTRHGVEMHGDAGRLCDALPLGIEHACRIVEQVAHDARAARAPDRDSHFFGGSDERVADHFELDDVERFHD